MSFPLDIHTHHRPLPAGSAVLNCFAGEFRPEAGGWYSVGIHPWRLGQSPWQEEAFRTRFQEAAAHLQVVAVGEAGIDRLADAPLGLQLEALRYQAAVAEAVRKPLVLHLVKAAAELLALKRELRPTVPWVIHGFRGKAQLADTYLKHGFFLSFGEKYQEEALRRVPLERLFIETDESTVPVARLYERAAGVRGLSADELLEAVSCNVCRVFFVH